MRRHASALLMLQAVALRAGRTLQRTPEVTRSLLGRRRFHIFVFQDRQRHRKATLRLARDDACAPSPDNTLNDSPLKPAFRLPDLRAAYVCDPAVSLLSNRHRESQPHPRRIPVPAKLARHLPARAATRTLAPPIIVSGTFRALDKFFFTVVCAVTHPKKTTRAKFVLNYSRNAANYHCDISTVTLTVTRAARGCLLRAARFGRPARARRSSETIRLDLAEDPAHQNRPSDPDRSGRCVGLALGRSVG